LPPLRHRVRSTNSPLSPKNNFSTTCPGSSSAKPISFADQPAKGVTGGGVVSGALHSFVLSAALELQGRYRVNVVSPTMVSDSVDEYAPLFPGLSAVPMDTLVGHYVDCIETEMTGQIIRAYG